MYEEKLNILLNSYNSLKNYVIEFGNIFLGDYKVEVTSYKKSDFNEFKNKTFEENREILRNFTNEFNGFIQEMENLDFDLLDKPHKFVKKGKTIVDANDALFQPIYAEGDNISFKRENVITDFVIRYLSFQEKVEKLIEILNYQIEEILSPKNYSQNLDIISNKYIKIRNKAIEDKNAIVLNMY